LARLHFLIFSKESASRINQSLLWTGSLLEKIFPNTEADLARTGLQIGAKNFLAACAISSFFYALFFAAIISLVGILAGSFSILFTAVIFIVLLAMFVFATSFSPKIVSAQKASELDEGLILALRYILLQISSGSSLYDSMVNVAKSNYGIVSLEFKKVIQSINSGDSEVEALEKIALNSGSEYLSRACWQILTSLRSGSSLAGSISSVVDLLLNERERRIKNYSAEMNLFVLLYLLFAAAIPTLGVTFLVIFSALGGTKIGAVEILGVMIAAFITQLILVSFVKSRTPRVYD